MADDGANFSFTDFLLGLALGYLGAKTLSHACEHRLPEAGISPEPEWADSTRKSTPFRHTDIALQTTHPENRHCPYLLADNRILGPDWLPPRTK